MRRFEAAVLPPAVLLESEREAVASYPAVEVISPVLGPDDVGRVCDALLAEGSALAERGADDLAGVLGTVGERFLDAGDALRREALELLPPTAGVSAPMASTILDGMARDWTRERIVRMLRTDLGSLDALDGFAGPRPGTRTMAVGPALCVQIVAGSVPGVGVSALLRSLAIKAPTLLKPGLGDVVLPVLFARALAEEDDQLAAATAVVYWPGASEALARAAMARADVATVYGSDATVASLRAASPVTTRLVAYHHRVGVGAVGADALSASTIASTADAVARAVAVFDQRGCVSPRIVYVEEARRGDLERFGAELARALAELEGDLPAGPIDGGEAARLHQVRQTAEMLLQGSGGSSWHGGRAGGWTVLAERDAPVELGGSGRFVRLRALVDPHDLALLLAPLAPHLQTLAVAGFGERLERVARACARTGVSRVVSFDEAPFPPAWWRHDGRGPVAELVRWVELSDTL